MKMPPKNEQTRLAVCTPSAVWRYKMRRIYDDSSCNRHLRPGKKVNMFLVRVAEKYQKEGIFIFYFLLGDSSKYSY